MPELRQDPVTLRWVAIATERAKRPHAFTRAAKVEAPAAVACPFCPGHEAETPPEVMAYRAPGSAPDTPGWQVRVVPNLYPAFGPAAGSLDPHPVGPYTAMHALGVHEVLISTPEHHKDIGELPLDAVQRIVSSCVDRYRAHRDNPVVQYILIINNVGREAGASREHPHSQLFGIPLIPIAVAEELDGVQRYRAAQGTCPYCDIGKYEQQVGERLIYENDAFLVFAPYAGRMPFESWLMPKAHRPFFEDMGEEAQRDCADALRALVAKLHWGLNEPPFNYFIHTTPCHEDIGGAYHWHLELLPKLSIAAGFELGSGMMINTVLPEQAAEFLRETAGGDTLPRPVE